MGFFSGITNALGGALKTITGGSDQQSASNSGFGLLPPELQNAYNQYGTQLSNFFQNAPTPQFSPAQSQALSAAQAGTAATPQSFQNDLNMLMGNPYNNSVIDLINKQAAGQNSLVNQAGTLAGQQGSNRNFLATSDVEQNRLNNIGALQQQQYNNAVNQILGPLTTARQGDIQNLFSIGTAQQQLPFQNLQMYGTLLGAIPQSGGSTSSGSGSSTNALFPSIFGMGR